MNLEQTIRWWQERVEGLEAEGRRLRGDLARLVIALEDLLGDYDLTGGGRLSGPVDALLKEVRNA